LSVIAVDAASSQSPTHPDCISMSATFVAKALEDSSATLATEVLAIGRTTSHVKVTLSQEGAVRSFFVCGFADLARFRGITMPGDSAPSLPPLELCTDAAAIIKNLAGGSFKIANQLVLRVSPGSTFDRSVLGWQGGGREALLEGYGGFSDGQHVDVRALHFFGDAFPPPALCLSAASWVPTLSYSVSVLRRPAPGPGPLTVRFVTTACVNSLLETDGTMWDSQGHLCARSRQLARVLQPKL
jgi:hypothetical protein